MNQAVSQCSERRRALLEMIEHQQINRLPDVLDSAKCSLQMFCVLCRHVQKCCAEHTQLCPPLSPPRHPPDPPDVTPGKVQCSAVCVVQADLICKQQPNPILDETTFQTNQKHIGASRAARALCKLSAKGISAQHALQNNNDNNVEKQNLK